MDERQKKTAKNKVVSRSFRCTQEEYEAMKDLSEKSGKNFSHYIIDCATKSAGGTDIWLSTLFPPYHGQPKLVVNYM